MSSHSFLDRHNDLTLDDTTILSSYFHDLQDNQHLQSSTTLRGLPLTSSPSFAPLDVLSTLIENAQGSWPVFELVLTHTRAWKHLPEDAKAGRATAHDALLRRSISQVKISYSSLLDLIPTFSDAPAIFDPETQQYLTHGRLHNFIKYFRLPIQLSVTEKPVVAVALPNGPLLGLAVLSIATYYTAAPVNPAVGIEQFKADVLLSKASVLLVTQDDVERLHLNDTWINDAGIQVFIADLSGEMTMTISDVSGKLLQPVQDHPASQADDIAIILFTSGTR